jgi:hypothetical protein
MKDETGIKNSTERAWSAKSIKPQTVKNTYGRGHNEFTPGKVPLGGLTTVWDFSGRPNDTKNSPTSKPEPQNRIIGRGK